MKDFQFKNSASFRVFKRTKLLIIGAGCSLNYCQGTSNIEGLLSPVDSNFFKMAKKVLLRTRLDQGLTMQIEGVVHHLHRLYGYTPVDIRIGLTQKTLKNF